MAISGALVYDPRYHTFESWASLMTEQYADQQLQIPTTKTDWREWGQRLLVIAEFSNEAVSNPDHFADWQDWAASLIGAVNPGGAP